MPGPADAATMLVAVFAVSTSGPLMAATAAPALAIAFWRNGMASGLLAPWTARLHRDELRSLRGRERMLAVVAGALLAVHFATWVPSLRYTSVASATALVSTQPIWAALLARRAGARIARIAWAGIIVAVCGAGVLTGADVHASGRALAGDLLALTGGMFAAGYMVAGSEVRRHVSTATYTTVCYATTAALLLVSCLLGRVALTGYPASAWWRLAAVTAGAQFLGHSLFNRVLRRVSPTMVSLAILFEVPGAAAIAAIWLHQHPHASAVPGLVLLLVGIGLVVAGRGRGTEPSVPVSARWAPITSLSIRLISAPVWVRVKNASGIRCTWSNTRVRRSRMSPSPMRAEYHRWAREKPASKTAWFATRTAIFTTVAGAPCELITLTTRPASTGVITPITALAVTVTRKTVRSKRYGWAKPAIRPRVPLVSF